MFLGSGQRMTRAWRQACQGRVEGLWIDWLRGPGTAAPSLHGYQGLRRTDSSFLFAVPARSGCDSALHYSTACAPTSLRTRLDTPVLFASLAQLTDQHLLPAPALVKQYYTRTLPRPGHCTASQLFLAPAKRAAPLLHLLRTGNRAAHTPQQLLSNF